MERAQEPPAMTTRVGISGWRYPPWRGSFYPRELPQRAELQFAAAHLPIIEINGSFYSLQRPGNYASWYADTPADFVFSVKGPRFITHMKKLREVRTPLANFFASGIFNLRDKLGPILWQFPPNFGYEPTRFREFLELLPRDTAAAALLAQACDAWLRPRSLLEIDANRPLRYAVEIRHESFLVASFVELLREFNVALVIAETARRWPMTHDITADFIYMRLHGDKELYRSGYSDRSLERWAERIRAWQRGEEPSDALKIVPELRPSSASPDVYCFFDNTDVKLRAPFDAQSLLRKLGLAKTVSFEIPTRAAARPSRSPARPRRKKTTKKKKKTNTSTKRKTTKKQKAPRRRSRAS
jgi:uncharacterized protein YecE (DUF72 family)